MNQALHSESNGCHVYSPLITHVRLAAPSDVGMSPPRAPLPLDSRGGWRVCTLTHAAVPATHLCIHSLCAMGKLLNLSVSVSHL